MTGRVEGKVAFVTGAARGQGRSHALRLAEEGADIIAVDICGPIPGLQYSHATEEDLAETVRQVEALDRRIVARKADVRDRDAMKAAIDEGVAELGHLDIVVGNAGICILAPWDEVTPEVWNETISTNLTGVFNTVQLTAPHLIAGGRRIDHPHELGGRAEGTAVPHAVRRVEVRRHRAHQGVRARAREAQHPRELAAPHRRRHRDGRDGSASTRGCSPATSGSRACSRTRCRST